MLSSPYKKLVDRSSNVWLILFFIGVGFSLVGIASIFGISIKELQNTNIHSEHGAALGIMFLLSVPIVGWLISGLVLYYYVLMNKITLL